jgi:hypothetical protein
MPMTTLTCGAVNVLIYRTTWSSSQNFPVARWVERIVISYRDSVRQSVALRFHDDFRSVLVNGGMLRKRWRDNGHLGHSAECWPAVRGMPTGLTLRAMQTTIRAADRTRAL